MQGVAKESGEQRNSIRARLVGVTFLIPVIARDGFSSNWKIETLTQHWVMPRVTISADTGHYKVILRLG